MTLAQRGVRLLVVVDYDYLGNDFRWLKAVERIGEVAVGCPVGIQARLRGATQPERAVLASLARDAVPRSVPLILNGEVALAERLGFTGVHWPEALIPESRPPHAIPCRTASVHSTEAIGRAQRAGADAVLFGAVYAPGSHPGEALGLEALRAAVHAAPMDVFAIGGITPDNLAACFDAGARGVAVVSGILGAPDIAEAVMQYVRAIEQALEGKAT